MLFRSLSGILIALLAVAIAVLHHFAMEYFFYWRFWWFDILMHVAGGVFFGAAFSWVMRYEFSPVARVKYFSVAYILLAVFAVGITWEIFEVDIGIAGSPFMPYVVDTLKDLADDCLGGVLGFILMQYRYER